MSYNSLREFLERLDSAGEVARVTEPVSTILEMTEIQTRLLAEQGPCVIFENPQLANNQSADIPVIANLFGTVKRIALAITFGGKERTTDADLREAGEMLAFLRQPKPPAGFKDALNMLPLLKSVLSMKPKTAGGAYTAPCQELVFQGSDIDLGALPIQTCWPNEPAPLITWPIVVTRGPTETAEDDYNLGVYRMQVAGHDKTLMRWLPHRGGAQQYSRWRQQKNEPMPAAVVIGADPATLIAAVTPVPDTLSEYQFAGLLRGKQVELAPCQTIPLKVPAEAEIVLEGEVSLTDRQEEGPFGDHTGYYNAVETFPVFTVKAVTMRRDPMYLSTFTGRPPDEPSVLGEALNEIFIPLLQQQFPEIIDCWLPPEACSYRIAVVSIRKAYPGHAKRIMMGLWSFLRQFMYTKWVIVIDDDVDARNWKDVMWAISTRMDPKRDMTIIGDTPIDYLDFASPEPGLGSKIGLDATNKWPPETKRVWGTKIRMSEDIVKIVNEKWPSLGLPGPGKSIWSSPAR